MFANVSRDTVLVLEVRPDQLSKIGLYLVDVQDGTLIWKDKNETVIIEAVVGGSGLWISEIRIFKEKWQEELEILLHLFPAVRYKKISQDLFFSKFKSRCDECPLDAGKKAACELSIILREKSFIPFEFNDGLKTAFTVMVEGEGDVEFMFALPTDPAMEVVIIL